MPTLSPIPEELSNSHSSQGTIPGTATPKPLGATSQADTEARARVNQEKGKKAALLEAYRELPPAGQVLLRNANASGAIKEVMQKHNVNPNDTIIWPDGKRLSVQDAAIRFYKDHPELPPEKIALQFIKFNNEDAS